MSISDLSFQRIAALVRRDSSMVYDAGKEYLVEARLLPLAKEAGFADVDSYIRTLDDRARTSQEVLDALMINETSWFRDNHPYQVFISHALPALMESCAATRRLRIWSAACSSGQEAFSLAMILDQNLPAGWDFEITCTDISSRMIERVRAGRFTQLEINRGMPAPLLVRYFTRSGAEWQVADSLRGRIKAERLNLAEPFPSWLGPFDAVFMRNVLIYFDLDTKADILSRTSRLLTDGLLMLGSTESLFGPDLSPWSTQTVGRVNLHWRTAQRAAALAAAPASPARTLPPVAATRHNPVIAPHRGPVPVPAATAAATGRPTVPTAEAPGPALAREPVAITGSGSQGAPAATATAGTTSLGLLTQTRDAARPDQPLRPALNPRSNVPPAAADTPAPLTKWAHPAPQSALDSFSAKEATRVRAGH